MNITEAAYIVQYEELIATNVSSLYFGIASFVVLLYDHILTFNDEVHYIWCSNKKLVSWLFLLNRYVTPLGFIINISAYTSTLWTPLMFMSTFREIRGKHDITRHLYRVNDDGSPRKGYIPRKSICTSRAVVSVFDHGWRERVVTVYGAACPSFPAYPRVQHDFRRTHVRLLNSNQWSRAEAQYNGSGSWGSASAWLPLLYDTVVVGLVMYRTRELLPIRTGGQYRVVETLMKDGLMYYSVILAANLVLAVMIVRSSDGVKNICAQFQLLITVTMMSRITLNLRKNMQRPVPEMVSSTDTSVMNITRLGSSSRPGSRADLLRRASMERFRHGRNSTGSKDLEAYVLDTLPEELDSHGYEEWRDH
ncbi:hypothetical protein JB92DRAFT_3119403 [Gautieria morchelliformis]|nr:hypothetical protein JB92DRAFT_3119403 [Gautieria morchelliformis]